MTSVPSGTAPDPASGLGAPTASAREPAGRSKPEPPRDAPAPQPRRDALASQPRRGALAPQPRRDAWASARHVLCVRLDGLGDVLMTSPALRALRRARPDRRLTLLTSPAGAEVARLLPEISETIVYEAPWMKVARTPDPGPDLAMVEALRRRGFDAAVIFTVNTQSALPAALLCHLAGIPLRLAHARENVYGLLTDRVPEPETALATRHEVQRQLDLVGHVGSEPEDAHLSLRVPPGASRRVHARVAELGIDQDRPWAVVHPGASAPSRRYPAESFAEVARALVHDHGWQLVFTGSGPDEVALVEAIRRAACIDSPSLAGQLDLPCLAALLAMAPLVITNNTGPMHVAAAVGAPVVALYALTNPQHTPWGVPSRVLSFDVPCRWCLKSVCPEGHHLCLRGVEPRDVVSAALDLAVETGTSSRTAAAAFAVGRRGTTADAREATA